MADFSLPPVTDLESARALIEGMEAEFSSMAQQDHSAYADLSPFEVRGMAYGFAAQRLRDVLFQFPKG